ncbi:MAG: hypothetical protein HC809_07280 [Gammaproteobacteria bacterium]|nr:hypothetical protein [Gammaproteobacteria bacterium]
MNDRYKTELRDYLEGKLPDHWRRTLESDPEFTRQLADVDAVVGEVRALANVPSEPPPPWSVVVAQLARTRRAKRVRRTVVPLSVAAGALLAVFVGMSQVRPGPSGLEVAGPVDRLIAQSQGLERMRAGPVHPEAWSAAERGVAIRLADVDVEISDLGEAADASRRQRLWQQRVDLLRSLLDQERGRSDVPVIL